MNKPLRILQVFGSLNVGGAESRMMDVFRGIDRDACHMDFLTMLQDEQYFEDEIRSLGGKVIKLPPPRQSGTLKNLRELTRILRDGEYDAVHAHTSFHCGVAMLAGKRAGIPVRISHARTTGSPQTGLPVKLCLLLGRMLTRRYATCRLAISPEAGAYLFGRSPFFVLPNAIDLSAYSRITPEQVAACRTEARLTPGDFVVGQVGRFDPMKNHAFSVRLFQELLRQMPNAKLVFVGDGQLRPEIERQAAGAGIADRVRFLGIRDDVPVWMRLFDVLIVPSVFEGLGGVILEAQAAGTPVIKADSFTDASDLGLGLVTRCSLDSVASWVDAMNRLPEAPAQEAIDRAFYTSGYSLEYEIKQLYRCYRGGQPEEETT